MSAYNVMITKKEGLTLNLSTVALLLLAWYAFSGSGKNTQNNRPKTSPLENLSSFLSDDTQNILNCVNTLSSNNCSQEDKTSAILQMMANPAVMNIASSFFGGGKTEQGAKNDGYEQTDKSESCEHVNSEGYRYETPSASSQEFFRPIDNIADTEVKHKLYWFYDNWYVK